MPHKGYIPTQEHKNKISIKAKLRGNGWLGRRHSIESIKKMQRPHSASHIEKIRLTIQNRWNKNKPQWLVEKAKVKRESVAPVAPMYRDIFENVIIDSEGQIWEEV
jgi:hypothetical protein